MRRTPLSQRRVKELFSFNPCTGVLSRKIRVSNGIQIGEEAGWVQSYKDGRRVKVDRLDYQVTTIIWLLVYGYWPKGPPYEVVDHMDRNPFNNSIWNLQLTTSRGNMRNQSKHSNNRSGVSGVRITKSLTYEAYITNNYKQTFLGTFKTLEEAAEARRQAELKYWRGDE